MARTSSENKKRAADCHDYEIHSNGRCELYPWIANDAEARRWMRNITLKGSEVHHITGRGRGGKREWYCNLILLDLSTHHWVHHEPAKAELACYYAKYRRHLAQLVKPESEPLLHWNMDAMDGLVKSCNSLTGRISYLMHKVGDGMYCEYGQEILNDIDASDISF